MHQLTTAEQHGALEDALVHFGRPHLLILDELGYLPLVRSAGHLLFRVFPATVRDRIR